jgi:hypothetical protein
MIKNRLIKNIGCEIIAAMNEREMIKILERTVNKGIDTLKDSSVNMLKRLASLEYYKEYKSLKEKYEDDKSFNLFKDLTTKEIDERFYSKILSKILDPDTPEIGNIEYLKLFIQLLREKNPRIIDYTFTKNNVEVKTEQEYIDILIADKEYAIIIENKIANAADQENQLARYYETVIKDGLTPLAVVYIPPNHLRNPHFETYTGKYKKRVDDIKKIYVQLPALDSSSNNHNDLSEGFIDKCVQIAKNDKKYVAWVFMDQFSKLIKYNGRVLMMANLTRKKIVEEIYSNYETVGIANEIGEIWKGKEKDQLLEEILREKFKEKLKINEYPNNNSLIGKDVGNVFVGIWPYVESSIIIGFIATNYKEISKDLIDSLTSILDNKIPSEYFDKTTLEGKKKEVVRYFKYDKYGESLTNVIDYISEKYNLLVEEVKKLTS